MATSIKSSFPPPKKATHLEENKITFNKGDFVKHIDSNLVVIVLEKESLTTWGGPIFRGKILGIIGSSEKINLETEFKRKDFELLNPSDIVKIRNGELQWQS